MGAASAIWNPTMGTLIKRLRDRSALAADFEQEVEPLVQQALSSIRSLTPRSEDPRRTGPHAADLWEIKRLGPARYVITNPLNFSTLGRPRLDAYPSFNLLLALEYGTGNHLIPAGSGGLLHFFYYEGREKKWIRTDVVHHPGTRAYRMVGRTEALIGPQFEAACREVAARALGLA